MLEGEFEEIIVVNIVLHASSSEQIDFIFDKIQRAAMANVNISTDFSDLIPEVCLKVVNPEICEVLFELIFSIDTATAKNQNIFLIQH